MSFIFNAVGDVAVFFAVTLLCFGDLFSGVYFRMAGKDGYAMSDWYQKGVKRMPGMRFWRWWIFPIVWFILKVLIITALYIFYQQITLNAWFGSTCDTVTLLFIFNIALNAMWAPVFFELRMPWLAWLICLALIGTGAAILYEFSIDGFRYLTSFWLFIWYPIWCIIALCLNTAWVVYDWRRGGIFRRGSKKEKKKCDAV